MPSSSSSSSSLPTCSSSSSSPSPNSSEHDPQIPHGSLVVIYDSIDPTSMLDNPNTVLEDPFFEAPVVDSSLVMNILDQFQRLNNANMNLTKQIIQQRIQKGSLKNSQIYTLLDKCYCDVPDVISVDASFLDVNNLPLFVEKQQAHSELKNLIKTLSEEQQKCRDELEKIVIISQSLQCEKASSLRLLSCDKSDLRCLSCDPSRLQFFGENQSCPSDSEENDDEEEEEDDDKDEKEEKEENKQQSNVGKKKRQKRDEKTKNKNKNNNRKRKEQEREENLQEGLDLDEEIAAEKASKNVVTKKTRKNKQAKLKQGLTKDSTDDIDINVSSSA
jgi:hypothetical protein